MFLSPCSRYFSNDWYLPNTTGTIAYSNQKFCNWDRNYDTPLCTRQQWKGDFWNHRSWLPSNINFNTVALLSSSLYAIKKLIDCTFQKCHLKKTSAIAGAIIAFKNNFRHFTFYQTGNPRKNGSKNKNWVLKVPFLLHIWANSHIAPL